ncbi:MAG TPA: hypothetical protein PLV64_09390 [Anaerolineales bacterium]|nr:hypothetical protein [Anaerolineales bacterium]
MAVITEGGLGFPPPGCEPPPELSSLPPPVDGSSVGGQGMGAPAASKQVD